MVARDIIPIHFTHAEARAQLEEVHTIDYQEGILGATIYAHCHCGWSSLLVSAGFMAEEIARRHRGAFIEHPLENRARFAIYRDDRGRWTLLDRSDGYGFTYRNQAGCVHMLNTKLRSEAKKR